MNYFQHFIRNLRRSGRAELPCVGSIEGAESAVAPLYGTLTTMGFGIVGAGTFICLEGYGERVRRDVFRRENENSYRSSPLRAIGYDITHSISSFLYAPVHFTRTMAAGNSKERTRALQEMGKSFWTGLTAELIAFVPASYVVERIIPIGRDLSLREPEYWLSWFGALAVGWCAGTLGIAAKLGFDDWMGELGIYGRIRRKFTRQNSK